MNYLFYKIYGELSLICNQTKYIIKKIYILVNTAEDEEAAAGVTYFVDDEGRYYYQRAGDDQNLVSLQTEGDGTEVRKFFLKKYYLNIICSKLKTSH